MKDTAWVADAQTRLEAGPWPVPDGADADPGHLLRVLFVMELWLADYMKLIPSDVVPNIIVGP